MRTNGETNLEPRAHVMLRAGASHVPEEKTQEFSNLKRRVRDGRKLWLPSLKKEIRTGRNHCFLPQKDLSFCKYHGRQNDPDRRVESDTKLKGSKRIIVQKGNVYIGKGRKDDRNILIIPATSPSTDRPNIIENLLLLNISFRSDVPIDVIVKALGERRDNPAAK